MIWGSEQGGAFSCWVGYATSGQVVSEQMVYTPVAFEALPWAQGVDLEHAVDKKSLICKTTGLYSVSVMLTVSSLSGEPISRVLGYIDINTQATRYQLLKADLSKIGGEVTASASAIVRLDAGDALAVTLLAIDPVLLFVYATGVSPTLLRSHISVARIG